MKVVFGYFLAVLATYSLGALFVSQGNIAEVVGMGFEITMSHRIDAVIHDLTHMYDLYLPIVAVGMLIGLSVAALIINYVIDLRLIGYVSAGFVALVAIHVLIKATLGLSGIAPTREIVGLLMQGLAGAAGGYVFHYVTLQHQPRSA
ncbi:MAG: hypothetical protein JJ921_15650 [Pseudomonadales bacterium]|nr:hypothetical protein [Pseudomonadales bacterium]MBO6703776.1 hypothetical protein [Pseudomonadales bacterium]MBO7005177.1 hypothetical protein [Pseudomonadales bacterium]